MEFLWHDVHIGNRHPPVRGEQPPRARLAVGHRLRRGRLDEGDELRPPVRRHGNANHLGGWPPGAERVRRHLVRLSEGGPAWECLLRAQTGGGSEAARSGTKRVMNVNFQCYRRGVRDENVCNELDVECFADVPRGSRLSAATHRKSRLHDFILEIQRAFSDLKREEKERETRHGLRNAS